MLSNELIAHFSHEKLPTTTKIRFFSSICGNGHCQRPYSATNSHIIYRTLNHIRRVHHTGMVFAPIGINGQRQIKHFLFGKSYMARRIVDTFDVERIHTLSRTNRN